MLYMSLFPVGALFVAVELRGGEFVFIEYCCYFCLLLGRNELVSLLGVIESALAAEHVHYIVAHAVVLRLWGYGRTVGACLGRIAWGHRCETRGTLRLSLLVLRRRALRNSSLSAVRVATDIVGQLGGEGSVLLSRTLCLWHSMRHSRRGFLQSS